MLGCLGGTRRSECQSAPSPRGVPRRAVPWATNGAAKAEGCRAPLVGPSGSSAVLCAAAAKDPELERPELGVPWEVSAVPWVLAGGWVGGAGAGQGPKVSEAQTFSDGGSKHACHQHVDENRGVWRMLMLRVCW